MGRLLHNLPDGLIARKTSLHAAVKGQLQWIAKVSMIHGRHGTHPDKTPFDRRAHRATVLERKKARDAERKRKKAIKDAEKANKPPAILSLANMIEDSP